MRRLGRLMLNALSALSLLLCMATLTLCVRSEWISERWAWARNQHGQGAASTRDVRVWSSRGGVEIYATTYYRWVIPPVWPPLYERRAAQTYPYVPVPAFKQGQGWEGGGITWFKRTGSLFGQAIDGPQIVERALVLPYWLIAGLAAPLPLWRALALRRRLVQRRRQQVGACLRCGYLLQGNVSGVCPVCGTKIVGAR